MAEQSTALAPAHPDILTLLREGARTHPDATAIEDVSGRSESYRGLLDRVEHLGARIAQGAGQGEGRPRVGIVLPNGLEFSETLLAVTVIGTALPFNPRYTPHEFETYFAETEIRLLVTRTGFADEARQAALRLGIAVLDIDALPETGALGPLQPPAPDDTAMVLLTSGSTGRAKRVPLSHRNVCTAARDVSVSLRLTPDDRCLSMWELFHVGGLVDLLLAPLHSRSTVIATAGFDAVRFFDILSQRKPTWFQAVPTALGEVALIAAREGVDLSRHSLRFLRSVAAALSPALMAEIEALFRVPVLQTFGMTEAAPLICSTGFDAADRLPGSVGRSCGTEIGIFDDRWQRQPQGVEGEVAIRGPNVFAGYEADPEANRDAFREGWFRTGDLGRIDTEGRLFLTGRIKELVNRGGEKVNLREVDDALLSLGPVFEAACFPVPHRTLGEDVAAAVVLRPGASITAEEIRSALSGRLAAFKLPRDIAFVPALPRNAVGKIDRRQLAADMIARLQAAPGPAGAPATETEARIAAIWARELGLPSVGPEQDFVRLGGDSLAALRMLLAVEAETGTALPDNVLSRISTVRDMVRILEAEGQAGAARQSLPAGSVTQDELRQMQAVMSAGSLPVLRPGSCLKVANPAGGMKPLIWFFNSPAIEMPRMVAQLSPDRPLYGGFSGGKLIDMGDASMARLARYYVAELLEAFPTGDFLLGGNCKGARLAWEVARQLMEAGCYVERLCMLEYSNADLRAFPRPLLLMFGKQSRQRAYLPIAWGGKDWERGFAHPPTVTWVEGTHGGFFQPDTIGSVVGALEAFLVGRPLAEGTLASAEGRRILRIHRNRLRFNLFRLGYKLASRLRHGRRARFDPLTGEVLPR